MLFLKMSAYIFQLLSLKGQDVPGLNLAKVAKHWVLFLV